MAAYYHNANVNRKLRRWRRAHRFISLLLFVLILFLVAGGVYLWQQSGKNDPQSAQTKITDGGYYVANPKFKYTNELFTFESTKQWDLSREASILGSKYVFYTQLNGGIVHELDINIDSSIKDKPINYVMPVRVQAGTIVTDTASPRCNANVSTTGYRPISFATGYNNVKFICDNSQTKQVIAAGIAGGSLDIPLYNTKGTLRNVNFVLIDHSDHYYQDTFKDILESFKLK